MELKKFWKTFLISLGCVLLMAGGVYIYFKDPFGFRKIKVDKYSEILDWCDVSNSKDELDVDCKALLLNIRNKENGDGCFDVEVISNEENLESINICEQNEAFSFSNEVLQYKKLMPIDATFVFQREQFLGKYIFKSVTFSPVDTSYIQEMINKDVKYLSGIKSSNVTTIKNSVNFCPIPENLPSYIGSDNLERYTTFYKFSKLTEDSFSEGSFYNPPVGELNLIFSCESQNKSLYSTSCSINKIKISEDLRVELSRAPMPVNFTHENNAPELTIINNLSVLSEENTFVRVSNESEILRLIINSFNEDNSTTPEMYCALFKLLSNSLEVDSSLEKYLSYMKNFINGNILSFGNMLCYDSINFDRIDPFGYYIYNMSSDIPRDNNFYLLDRCQNLYNILKFKYEIN